MAGIDPEGEAQRRLLEALAQSPELMGQQDTVMLPGMMPKGTPMRNVRAQQAVRPASEPSFFETTRARMQAMDEEAFRVLDELEVYSEGTGFDPQRSGLISHAGKYGRGYVPGRGTHVGWKGADDRQRKILMDYAIRHGLENWQEVFKRKRPANF